MTDIQDLEGTQAATNAQKPVPSTGEARSINVFISFITTNRILSPWSTSSVQAHFLEFSVGRSPVEEPLPAETTPAHSENSGKLKTGTYLLITFLPAADSSPSSPSQVNSLRILPVVAFPFSLSPSYPRRTPTHGGTLYIILLSSSPRRCLLHDPLVVAFPCQLSTGPPRYLRYLLRTRSGF